jgi:hypothetical protein
MVLSKMKETAEAFLGKKVTHAVVTVPVCEVSIRVTGEGHRLQVVRQVLSWGYG